MAYRVTVSADAYDDLDNILDYLVFVLKNDQAALSVLDDFEKTMDVLKETAGSYGLCSNPKLSRRGYRRINFRKHEYFMLYRIKDGTAVVDKIFHSLQDYESKIR